jgi:bla regulator protein BlaR1
MGTLTTGNLLTDQFIKALGNTLMHSLWQGVLLAVAGGFIVIFTKKLSAALRYNLLLGAMVLFTCGVIFTFCKQLQPAQTSRLIYKGGNTAASSPVTIQAPPVAATYIDKQSTADTIIGYLNAHCNTIVLIWFLIICAKGIKLAVGIHEVYHLKHTKTYAVSKYWESRLADLSDQLNIKQAIRLVESGLAKVPMVIGHLKPLILIPVGFINALSADEVEAILVHELAHIGRRDYLVNLLQSFLEIIFFFNPAVLWISQLLKAERENCCDDIALKQAGNKSGYIQALLSCQEYQLAAPGLSMALARDKSKLLNRVKRMVNNHNQSLNIMEKTLLTICMVTGGLLTVAFSANKENKDNLIKVSALTHQQTKTDAQISGLTISGKKVQTSKENKYAPQINALLKQKQAEASQTPAATEDTSNGKVKIYKPAEVSEGSVMMLHQSKNGKAKATYVFKQGGKLYQIFMDRRMVESFYVNGEQKPVSQNRGKIDELLDEYAGITQPIPPMAPMAAMNSMAPMAPMTSAVAAATPMPPMAPTPMTAIAPMPPMKAMSMSMTPMPPMAPIPPMKPDGRYKEVTDALIKKGIIKDKNDFEMSLNAKRLTVDGILQPENIHQEILKIFVKKPGDKVNWNYNYHQTSESSEQTSDQ